MNGAFVYALTAALNPTLLAATTVMLLLDHPKRLLLGYLLGGPVTSVTLGLVIVFTLDGSASTAQHTLSPAMDLALGGILLVLALMIRPGRQPKDTGRLGGAASPEEGVQGREGTAAVAAQAESGLRADDLRRRRPPDAARRLLSDRAAQDRRPGPEHGRRRSAWSSLFNAIMLALLELPLIGFVFAPEWTPRAVDRFKEWFSRNARRLGFRVALVFGVLLIVRGLVYLL